VVEAFTGTLPPPESHTAESAYAAGLVDALLPGEDVPGWLGRVLTALTPEPVEVAPAPAVEVPQRSGWEQVQAARARTTGGAALLADLLTDRVDLRAPSGDETVAAAVGRLGGRPLVAVALAAQLGGRPTPNGYRLAARAYRLADRLGLPILSLVDTPGADPGTASEAAGIAPAMGEALDALLASSGPTLALVHGEGGSGGALAAAAADVVLVTPDAYFAAIGPEGAAAALRRSAQECADLMRVGPSDLLRLGFADAIVAPVAVHEHLALLSAVSADERMARRTRRWGVATSGYL
jgi:acetyl-CoA carboxylase carboxyl transferase subunit beta